MKLYKTMLKGMKSEHGICKCDEGNLVKDRLCKEYYKDAPSLVKELVNDRGDNA